MPTPLRLVYCITLYKYAELMLRSFALIYRPEHHYIFHVDKKAPSAIHQAVVQLRARYSNITVIPSQTVWWGHWAIMETHLRTMAEALKLPHDWDYWINITAQDFPCASQEKIANFLQQRPDACYLGLYPKDQWTSVHHARVDYYHWLWRSHIVALPVKRSPLPNDATPVLGSTYMMLPKAACHWLLYDPFAVALLPYFKNVPCSDEYYAQTALMNSHWAAQVVNDNRRGVVWHEGKPGPLVITAETLEEALRFDPFFVRKLAPESGESVFNALEQRCTMTQERTPL